MCRSFILPPAWRARPTAFALPGILALVGLLSVLTACGDPLVSGAFRGRPLLHLSGAVELPDGATFLDEALCEATLFDCYEACTTDDCPPCEDGWETCVTAPPSARPTDFRLGIFWAQGQGAPVVQQYSLTVSSFPARYGATLYAPPPADLLQPAERGQFTLGLVMVYLDRDDDGVFTAGDDPIVGGADGRAVLYTPNGLDDDRFGVLEPGYHRMSVLSVCTPEGGELVAEADRSDVILTLSANPELQRRLLLDPDCDGEFDDFAACDPDVVERWCAAGAHLLCDLCFDVLADDAEDEAEAEPEEG
ncbi:MAG: hypothetical protein ACI9U2_004293 [Bradymonadia bacterium]|jgi:hypothetical protein